jgi:hypothetical protein
MDSLSLYHKLDNGKIFDGSISLFLNDKRHDDKTFDGFCLSLCITSQHWNHHSSGSILEQP